jgi:hypothetical protein
LVFTFPGSNPGAPNFVRFISGPARFNREYFIIRRTAPPIERGLPARRDKFLPRLGSEAAVQDQAPALGDACRAE